MAKSKVTTEISSVSVSPNVRTIDEFGDAGRELASWLQIDLSASPNVRTERAMQAYNLATHHMVEAGLLLASVRADVGPEAFAAVLEERGMAKQRASELIRGAALVARLSLDQRELVMSLHKTKVVLLANASPAALETALEDDEIDIDLISVRALRQKIRDLEANGTDLQVQRDTAEAEAEGLRKKLKRGLPEREDQVPLVVADLRAEIMAQGKKATLALDAFNPLAADLKQLAGLGAAHDWADATLRLAVSQLVTLRLQVDGLVAKYLRELPGGDPTPAKATYLTKQEVLESARRFGELTQVHDYEKALREWEREQARPRGKGRPKDRPAAPGGAA